MWEWILSLFGFKEEPEVETKPPEVKKETEPKVKTEVKSTKGANLKKLTIICRKR